MTTMAAAFAEYRRARLLASVPPEKTRSRWPVPNHSLLHGGPIDGPHGPCPKECTLKHSKLFGRVRLDRPQHPRSTGVVAL